MDTKKTAPNTLMRMGEFMIVSGFKRATVYDHLSKKSPRYDPNLPRPVKLGNGRAIGFVRAEVDAYVEKNIAARDS